MKQILVIDDDAQLCFLMKQILESSGFAVIMASDGREGLEILSRQTVDLVITDIFMPEKEGIETITDIRAKFPDLKIVAVSGGGRSGSIEYLSMAQRLGASKTLLKPFSKDELIQVLVDLGV
ncbi:MAG: response regulator [Candidatus Riflebacteria bacterium]|nr:response regulator [Candidatus Riflebacteria bacterium]MBF0500503.1 response regulator [Candidatus Riflebacteria bacterium]